MTSNMIPYPSYSDLNSILDDLEDRWFERTLTHYASHLLGKGVLDQDDLEAALRKAIIVVATAMPPVTHHFKKIYVFDGIAIKTDWLVSDLGLQMILMNADVSNPEVARLQVQLLSKTRSRKPNPFPIS